MLNSSIVVIGSSNTDMVVKTERFPAPGETILGGNFFMNPGGKGANQAVAAARLGGNVSFVCKIGDDLFGSQSAKLFKEEGIDTSHILADNKNPSGVALITVDASAENSIVVAPGANASLSPNDLNEMSNVIKSAGFILIQLEIPIDTVSYVAKLAANSGVKVVLNPAPACSLPDEIFKYISIITPNEKEAEMLSGVSVNSVDAAKTAAQIIKNKGVDTVVITMSSKGALVYENEEFTFIEAQKVDAVDTTAAGDVFNGALVVALSEGNNLVDSVEFASKAAAVSVTKLGAQSSAPFRRELEQFEFV